MQLQLQRLTAMSACAQCLRTFLSADGLDPGGAATAASLFEDDFEAAGLGWPAAARSGLAPFRRAWQSSDPASQRQRLSHRTLLTLVLLECDVQDDESPHDDHAQARSSDTLGAEAVKTEKCLRSQTAWKR